MCIDLDGDDLVLIINEEHRKARKEHHCIECDRTIAAGETYLYEYGRYDGENVTYKTCAHCAVARKWIEINCRHWLYGGIQEDLQDHFVEGGSYPPATWWWLGRVLVGMRRKWAGLAVPPQPWLVTT